MADSESIPKIHKLDEDVVNRIAAGEVIQRPANAIKEMLENSLDAKSTSIQISVKQGGLKLIQIQDDGCGIRKEDLGIVCERFTTSKLNSFDDLKSISTYGFRGEALASITHVSHVTIVTKTRDSKCAYKAKYSDGKLVPVAPGHSSDPKPCAGNDGTQIAVEDLFYNVAIRRKALKNPTEEHNRIFDIVSKYAIHNSGVGFTFKKHVENLADLKTFSTSTTLDNIRTVYGTTVANELLPVDYLDEKCGFKLSAYVSNANYSVKKCTFILFINHRLVDSSNLKRALEAVYSNYLPKDKHPFLYISLELNPCNVDVNVHPTKHEVHFLHEDIIISSIQKCVETKLLGANESRVYYTQTLIPSLGATVPKEDSRNEQEQQEKRDLKVYAHQMVRTDSKSRKLEEFLGPVVSSRVTSVEPIGNSDIDIETVSLETCVDSENVAESDNKIAIASAKRKRNEEEYPGKEKGTGFQWREIRLTSVLTLRKNIEEASDSALKELLSNHTFVGCVDETFALIQHQTKLYLVNYTTLAQELFYQAFLKRFGNFGFIRLSNPAPLKSLVMLALNCEDSGWSQADGPKEDLASYAEKLLGEKSAMLLDYFSMEIDGNDNLVSIPMIFDKHVPDLMGLPMFVLRLATEVEWNSEQDCFHTFATECSKFYSAAPVLGGDSVETEMSEPSDLSSDDETAWKWTVEHVIFANLKKDFLPKKELLENGTFLEVANLPDLYKVFERC